MAREIKKVTSPEEVRDNMSYLYQKGNLYFFKDVLGVWVVLGRTSVVFPTLEKAIEFIF